jgi:hypothetical protein
VWLTRPVWRDHPRNRAVRSTLITKDAANNEGAGQNSAPRSMVYDWDEHEKTCYRLYIDERKSLEDIMEHLRVHHKFTPR